MSRKGFTHLGFEVTSVRAGDVGHHAVARFTCVGCGAIHERRVDGARLNPRLVTQRAILDGWDADENRKQDVLCPVCKARPKPKNNVDAALPPVAPPIKPAPVPPEVVKALTPMSATNTTANSPLRPITNDQRLQIRQLLDKHFDDAAGQYLDDMSDEKIAETANVPRKHVEQIREVGYGPIRTTPELEAARKDLARVVAELTEMDAKMIGLRQIVANAQKHINKAAGTGGV